MVAARVTSLTLEYEQNYTGAVFDDDEEEYEYADYLVSKRVHVSQRSKANPYPP